MSDAETITVKTNDGKSHQFAVHDGNAHVHAVRIETCGFGCCRDDGNRVKWYSAGDVVIATVD